jgi:1-acyl-sn-glycerol-3-phosphate acyltransferase
MWSMDAFAFDEEYTIKVFEKDLSILRDEYFRAELINKEKIPSDSTKVIFILNHSGSGMSWDNIIFDSIIWKFLRTNCALAPSEAVKKKLRRLVDPLLTTDKRNLNPFGIHKWWERTGCIPASFENFELAMQTPGNLMISPEGTNGIAKGFNNRYKLQRYSSSFVYMAIKHDATIVPVSVINAEYLRPFNYRNKKLNDRVRKKGIPYLPLGLGITQMFTQATYLTAYPSKLFYVVHDPIKIDKARQGMDRKNLRALTDEIQAKHQSLLDEALKIYHRPYELTSYIKNFITSKNKKYLIPYFWHEKFIRTACTPPLFFGLLYKLPILSTVLLKVFYKTNGLGKGVKW